MAADAAAHIRALAGTNPAAAADAAWAASDTLHVATAALGSRILRQAADAYDRAAPRPLRPHPGPSPAGSRLRQAARLISAFAYLTRDPALTPILLITRLAALAEAVVELRDSQQRAAQAAAARAAAAERLYAAARPAAAARRPAPPRAPHGGPARGRFLSRPRQSRPVPGSPHKASTARTKPPPHGRPADRRSPGRAAPPANPRAQPAPLRPSGWPGAGGPPLASARGRLTIA